MLRRAICAVALLAALPASAADPDPLPAETIRAAMETWQVPGLAVAVVRGDEPAVVRAWGVRDAESGTPVTPHTLFAVGSIAKSFTVAALAMLADENRFDWDAPVDRYAPALRPGGAALAGRVTVRDLVTHRTGIPRHDALWYLGAYDRDGLMARLRFLAPVAPLRSVFAYSNLMVAATGEALARIEGAPWETVMRRRILDPLGMVRTRLGLAAFRSTADRALPYFPAARGRLRIPPRDAGPVAAAASVYADAADMARYLRFYMADGAPAGKRLLSAAAVRTTRTAQIATGEAPRWPELSPAAYGLGFYVARYRGHAIAWHPGVIDGYAAMLSYLPDDRLGVVVLSNLSGGNPVPAAVTYALYDRLLGLSPLPWTERLRARRAAWQAGREAAAQRKIDTAPPSRPPAAYAGSYDNAAYGRMAIRADADGGALTGALHDIRFRLVPAGGDDWRVAETAWPLRAGLAMRFAFDGGGRAVRLLTPLADGPTYRLQAGDLVFSRAAAR